VLRIVLLLCLGCGGSEDPHSAGTCDQGWVQNGFETCELACEDSGIALGASGASCQAVTSDNSPVTCSKTFEFEGITGCCSVDSIDDSVVHFAECQ